MVNGSEVKNIEIFERSCLDINNIFAQTLTECTEGRAKATLVLQETQTELVTSQAMLTAAIEHEAYCLVVMNECQAEVNAAAAGLPYTAAWYAEATARLTVAIAKYEKAVAHRMRMEERVRLATQCVQIAVEMLESLNMRFSYCTGEIQTAGNTGMARMSEAYGVLTGYSLLQMPVDPNNVSFDDKVKNKNVDTDKSYIPNSYVTINGDRYRTDDNGNIYSKRNPETGEYENMPNSKYTLNGYNYTTDGNGRITSAGGCLQMKDHSGRPTINDAVGGMRATDEKGHLIGDQFNGSNYNGNLVAMDYDLNRDEWYNSLEKKWADYVKDGKDVNVNIKVVYEGNSNRPSGFKVSYTVDGEKFKANFSNK